MSSFVSAPMTTPSSPDSNTAPDSNLPLSKDALAVPVSSTGSEAVFQASPTTANKEQTATTNADAPNSCAPPQESNPVSVSDVAQHGSGGSPTWADNAGVQDAAQGHGDNGYNNSPKADGSMEVDERIKNRLEAMLSHAEMIRSRTKKAADNCLDTSRKVQSMARELSEQLKDQAQVIEGFGQSFQGVVDVLSSSYKGFLTRVRALEIQMDRMWDCMDELTTRLGTKDTGKQCVALSVVAPGGVVSNEGSLVTKGRNIASISGRPSKKARFC